MEDKTNQTKKIHLFQKVSTPDGKGIVVNLTSHFNFMGIEKESARVQVWFNHSTNSRLNTSWETYDLDQVTAIEEEWTGEYKSLAEALISLLRKHDENKPYLVSGGKEWTPAMMIEAIENKTEEGKYFINGLIKLSLDRILREKESFEQAEPKAGEYRNHDLYKYPLLVIERSEPETVLVEDVEGARFKIHVAGLKTRSSQSEVAGFIRKQQAVKIQKLIDEWKKEAKNRSFSAGIPEQIVFDLKLLKKELK